MRAPTSGVVPASTGSGSGLPSGGAVNQTVLNTAPGTGTWQDVSSAMAAGSSHLVLTDVAHIATWDLSAADKATLAGLGNHYAQYTLSRSTAQGAGVALNSGWTSVTDTDNYGANINSTGALTVPAGLGGLYVVTLQVNYPSANYAGFNFQQIAPSAGQLVLNETQLQSVSTQYGFNVTWAGFAAAGVTLIPTVWQNSSGAQTLTGWYGILLVAPSTAQIGVSGLVPIAKSGAYTALANDWVLCDTTGGTFAVTTPVTPVDGEIFAVTWRAGAAAPTITGTVLGSPTLGAVGNTLWLRYSTITTSWLVV